MKHNMLIYVKPAPFTSFSTVLNVPCLGNLVKSWVWHGIVIKVHEWQRNIDHETQSTLPGASPLDISWSICPTLLTLVLSFLPFLPGTCSADFW